METSPTTERDMNQRQFEMFWVVGLKIYSKTLNPRSGAEQHGMWEKGGGE